jgi:hypothetical protein
MYTKEKSMGSVVPVGTGVLAEETVSASAAVHGEYLVLKRCQIRRLMFSLTEAIVATSTPPVVSFERRPTIGSDTDVEIIGTLTLPNAAAIGATFYKDVEPKTLEVGDTIKLNHTVQAVGGSVAGKGYYGFELIDHPDESANNAEMIESI